MKNLLIFLLLVTGLLQAKTDTDKLSLFVNSAQNQVELKWMSDIYSSEYSYEIYRSEDGKSEKHLATIKPQSYKLLKKSGYSEDYIFMIYPFKDTKTFDDKIRVIKISDGVQGFRILKLMRDRNFARNIGQYYLDTSVKKDKLYTYKVEAYKNKKKVFQESISAYTSKKVESNDFMWVNAKGTLKGIELTWNVQAQSNYYNVYRKLSGEKEFRKINKNILYISREHAQKAKSLYTDTELNIGQKATYYVRRINMFSEEGKPSKKFSAQRKSISKTPKAVKNIFVNSSDKKITLRWRKEPKAISYNIYRSTISNGGFVKINKKPVEKEAYFDKDFQAGKNYYYYVTAVNMQGESNPSITMLAYAKDATPPSTPKNLSYSVKAGIVSLKWDNVEDKNLEGYRVYMSMDEDASEWAMVTKHPVKTNNFEHQRPKTLSRHYYFYRVTSVDKTFNESLESEIIKVKLPDVTPPNQPTIMRYQALSKKISFEWNQIIVYDFSHYNVYRKDAKNLIKLNDKPLINTMFVDTKPQDGVNEYIVTAVDESSNESNTSISKKIRLKDNKALKIKNFTLTKTSDGIKASFECDDKDYRGFKLFRSSGTILKYHNISNFVKTKSFEDKSISKNTTYFYMIKAYDESGNISESNVIEFNPTKKDKK